MAITCTIANTPVSVLNDGNAYIEFTSDGRGVATFNVVDTTGLLHFQPGQPISLTDTTNGYSFTGTVNDSQETPLPPSATIVSQVSCVDAHFIPDKRYYVGPEYQNKYAGDIATDLLRVLAAEGITAAYASDNDQSISDWNEGTLNGTVGVNNIPGGDLELAPAGTDLDHVEGGTGGFSGNALKFTGYVEAGFASAVIYRKIWSGSQVVVSGDALDYDVWIPSSNPSITASVDLAFSDGSFFSANAGAGNDGQGLGPQPSNDLSGLASDTWYSRNHGVSGSVIGKTITGVYVTLYGTSQGTYTAYYRRIKWVNGGTTKIDAFDDNTASPSVNIQGQNSGFINQDLEVVSTADKSGSAITTLSLSSVEIVRASSITWQTQTLGDATLATGTILIESSIDGGLSWLTCTNGGAIPQLVPGMLTTGINLQIRKTITQDKNPDAMNIISALEAVVDTSYSSGKSDVSTSFSSSNFSAGTNSNTVTSGSNLTLSGTLVPFNSTSNYVGVTTQFGAASGLFLYRNTLAFNNSSVGASLLRLDGVGNTWQNFTQEINVYVPTNAGDSVGMVFRTTNFGSGAAAFSYYAGVSTGAVVLQKGTNTTGGTTITTLATTTVSLTANSVHRLKIVANGTSLTVYLDDISMISLTDSSFNIAGYFGLRLSNSTGASLQVYYSDFGVTPALTGTWTSAAFSIAGAGNYGNSIITWDTEQTPDTTVIEVDISYDNGSTWHICTNGAAVPVLTSNLSLATYTTVKVRAILTSNNASAFPSLAGIYVSIQGYFSASGYRISEGLDLSPVGTLGSSLVSWSGIQPTNTSITIDTSLDSITWTSNVAPGTSSGTTSYIGSGSIAGLQGQTDPVVDTFNSDTDLYYTQLYETGGALAAWVWNTASNRLEAGGGTNAVLLYNSPSTSADTDVAIVMDTSDNGGVVWRWQDQSDFYFLTIHDASNVASPNTLAVYSVVSGTQTQIGSNVSINFVRGTPHVFEVQMVGNTITVYMDGSSVFSASSSAISAAGFAGLYTTTDIGGGSDANFYTFRLQFLGQSVTGQTVYSRVRLTSTDPTATSQVSNLTVTAHDPDIQNGAFIPSTNYSILNNNKTTIAQIYDDLAKRSNNYWWKVINNKLKFQQHQSTLAPWCLTGNDVLISNLKIDNLNDTYRTSQWITGGKDIISDERSFIGDGVTTIFNVPFPIASITSIAIGDAVQAVGIKGTDTGKDWYYTPGQTAINADTSAIPMSNSQSLTILYSGLVDITVNVQRPTEIAKRAALDGTSGIIDESNEANGLPKGACIQMANGYLDTFAQDAKKATFTTRRTGLQVGQLEPIFSIMGIFNGAFLITDVKIYWILTTQNGVTVPDFRADIVAQSGSIQKDWTRFVSDLARLV